MTTPINKDFSDFMNQFKGWVLDMDSIEHNNRKIDSHIDASVDTEKRQYVGKIQKEEVDTFIKDYLIITNDSCKSICNIDGFDYSKYIACKNTSNVLIKHNGNNFSVLKKAINTNIFQQCVKDDILFFDDVLVAGFIRSHFENINDDDFMLIIKDIFKYIVDEYVDEYIKSSNLTVVISINSVVEYFSKSLIRYFTDSYNLLKTTKKQLHNLRFIFLTDKSTELDKDIQIFINMHEFEQIDFELQMLEKIFYNALYKDIDPSLLKYFDVYNLPRWLISKWVIENNQNCTFDNLQRFLMRNYGFDIAQSNIKEEKIKEIETNILSKLKGQDFTVKYILQLFYGYMQTIRFKKPLVLFFAGPSGVGKTYLAKLLARQLGWPLVRKDMGEYLEWHSTAKLTGTAPGYAWYKDSRTLVDELKWKSNSIILFDEIEKAHPNVLKLLFSLLDEGIITDGKGNTAMLKGGHIIIFTSNIFTNIEEVRKAIMKIDPEREREFTTVYNMIREQEQEYANTKKLTIDSSEIMQWFNTINGWLKTALTKKIDNAFVNRIQLFSLFNSIQDKKILEQIGDLEYQNIIKDIADPEIKKEYEKVWAEKRDIIIETILTSKTVQERGGRDIREIVFNLLNSYIGIKTVNLFE